MIKTLNFGTQVIAVRGVPASIGLQHVNDPTVGCDCSILQLYGSSQKISHATNLSEVPVHVNTQFIVLCLNRMEFRS